jgi:hypothetical protein
MRSGGVLRRIVAAGWLLISGAVFCAQAEEVAVQLLPELTFVATGGYWQQESEGGSVRALVYSGGFEHVSSQLILQWIADPTPETPARVVASVPVEELDGQYSLDAPRVSMGQNGGPLVCLSGVQSYTGDPVNFTIEIIDVGRYRLREADTVQQQEP